MFARLIRLAEDAWWSHSAAAMSLAAQMLATLAGFAVTYMIGNSLGVVATGQFALVTQTAMLLGVIGLVGLHVGVVRHFAKTIATGAPLAFRAVTKVSILGLGLMLAISGFFWIAGDLVWAPLFGDVVPRQMVLILCVLLVARGGTQLFGALLR